MPETRELDKHQQELMLQASLLEKQSQEVQESMSIIEKEIAELQALSESLSLISKEEQKDIISSIGKGVHVRAKLADKNLLVEVGAGIVVEKTPEETQKVIAQQIKKLEEAKIHLLGKMEIYYKLLHDLTKDARHNHEH